MRIRVFAMAIVMSSFLHAPAADAQTMDPASMFFPTSTAACVPPGGVAAGTYSNIGSQACINNLLAMCCSGTATAGSCSCNLSSCTGSITCGGVAVTVTPFADPGGTISPNTPQTTAAGQTVTFTVTPSAGRVAAVGGTCGGTLVGTTYTTSVINANCTVVVTFPSSCLDVDGNGQFDALTDGLMLIRAMFGLTGTPVTNGAIGSGPSRTTWAQIRSFLNTACGTNFLP
jgi:hypothetical protein